MRIRRVVVWLIIVLAAALAVYIWSSRSQPSPPEPPSFAEAPAYEQPLRGSPSPPEETLRQRLGELIGDPASAVSEADVRALEAQFRRSLKIPLLITADYDIPTEDYVPKGTHAWLQALKAWRVTRSEDAVRWFEWLDDDTLVYSTLRGIYRKDFHGPAQLLVRAPMARMSYPSLSPDRRSVAAVVRGGILTADISSGAHRVHRFDKPISDITWAPDGRLVGFTTRTAVWTLDPLTRKMHRLHRAEYLTPYPEYDPTPCKVLATDDIRWSPDGRYVSVRQSIHGDPQWALVVLAGANGRAVRRVFCFDVSYLSWSPNCRTIAYADSGGEPDGYLIVLDVPTGRSDELYCGGTSTFHGKSAWSHDGRYVAFEFVGEEWGPVIDRYRPLNIHEPPSIRGRARPSASRMCSLEWHPARSTVAHIEELKPGTGSAFHRAASQPSLCWTTRVVSLSGKHRPAQPYAGYYPDIAASVPMPPIAGRKETPRWSPEGRTLAVLCDVSGRYQVWVTGLLSQPRNRQNAQTWLRAAREHLRTGDLNGAVSCLQNSIRLDASDEARLLLTTIYLRIAERETNPYQRWRLYRGAIFEASRVPFDSLDADMTKKVARAFAVSDSISAAFRSVADPSASP